MSLSLPVVSDTSAFLGEDVSLNFPAHRNKLLECLAAHAGDVILVKGGEQLLRNHDTDLIFRQQSPFLYVCGVTLPGCHIVIVTGEGGKEAESVLFVPDLDDHYPVWNGTPVALTEWAERAKTTKAQYVSERGSYLGSLLTSGRLKRLFALDAAALIEDSKATDTPWKDLKPLLATDAPLLLKNAFAKARATKFPEELELMRRASLLSAQAHTELMRAARPGQNEAQLDAAFTYYCAVRGCRHMAYIPIVGSGPRGAILHYSANNNPIKDGDLILVDAGAELRGYASDITRTFPANGKFTTEQRIVYEIVLRCQKEMVSRCVVGADFNQVLKKDAALLLLEGLIQHEFVVGVSAEEAYEKLLHRLFMPHGLGHLVGLDVHDCNIYPETPLEEDMLITIEPGVYFNPYLLKPAMDDATKAPYLNRPLIEKFMNFGGVRIEDIVHVTKDGPRAITSAAPKEIDEIERIMAGRA